MHVLIPLLDRVNVASHDDGCRFLDTTRLDAIEVALREAGSRWTLHASGPLFRLYSRTGSSLVHHPVLISSHADSNYESHFHRAVDGSAELIGTFDNSITNASVLRLMLEDILPDGGVVAFTGDEENASQGAADVIAHLRGEDHLPRAVIVLDITDDRFYGQPFTIENWYANGSLGLPTDSQAFHRHVLHAFTVPVASVPHDDAWADESWRYEKEGVHVVSLCIPTLPANPRSRNDWMHSVEGVRVRADHLLAYGEALSSLIIHLAATNA
jgi:hypothetical protein